MRELKQVDGQPREDEIAAWKPGDPMGPAFMRARADRGFKNFGGKNVQKLSEAGDDSATEFMKLRGRHSH